MYCKRFLLLPMFTELMRSAVDLLGGGAGGISGGLYQTHFTVVIAIVTVLLTWLVCFHVDPFIWR